MKKAVKLSILLGSMFVNIFPVAPSFSQTVSIISGTVNLTVSNTNSQNLPCGTCFSGFTASTVITSLGMISISSNGFNGTLSTPNLAGQVSLTTVSVNSSQLGSPGIQQVLEDETIPFKFIGTTTGTSPTGNFINAPTTINFSVTTGVFAAGFLFNPLPTGGIYPAPVTGGLITLSPSPLSPSPLLPSPLLPSPLLPSPSPSPLSLPSDSLQVRPDLLISYSTLVSSSIKNRPEYLQEYKDDFSIPSFAFGRILNLSDQ